MNTKLSVMAVASTPETKMVTDFMKFMSIPLRAFGHSCGLGLELIEVFLRTNFLSPSAFLNSFIVSELGVKPFCHHYLNVFWLKPHRIHHEPNSIIISGQFGILSIIIMMSLLTVKFFHYIGITTRKSNISFWFVFSYLIAEYHLKFVSFTFLVTLVV